MKKNISMVLAAVLCFTIAFGILPSNAASSPYQVSVTQTETHASAVGNTSGYGSLQYLSEETKKEILESFREMFDWYGGFDNFLREEGYTEEEFYAEYAIPEVALMNADGKLVMPYVPSINRYLVTDNTIYKNNGYYAYNDIDEATNGFYQLNGKALLNKAYRFARPFSDGIAFVREWNEDEGYKALLIDKNGNTVLTLPGSFNRCDGRGDNMVGTMFYTHTGMCGKYSEGLINFSCAYLFRESIFEQTGNRFQANRSMWLSGYMDLQGNVVIPQQFAAANAFSDGLAAVREAIVTEENDGAPDDFMSYARAEAGKWGFVRRNGEMAIPFQYDSVTEFHHGYAIVGKDGKFGAIDKTGATVVPLEYDNIYMGDYGTFVYRKGDEISLRTLEGKELWHSSAAECTDYSEFFNGVLYFIKDDTVGIVKVKDRIQKGEIDNDGKISPADARLTLRASVGLETLTTDQQKAADVDGDNKVTSADARLILRASVGLEDADEWL